MWLSAVPAGDLSPRGDMLAACKGGRPRWEAASGQWVWALSQGVKLGVDWGSRGALVQPRLLQGGSGEGRAALNLPLLFMSESDGSASKSGST